MHRLAFVFGLLLGLTVPAPAQEGEKKDQKFDRWEKDIAALERKDKEKPPPERAVLFAGSSSVRLWDLAKSFPGLDTINRGFGGSQIADSTHFAARLVLKHKPRAIVFYAGDNDIAAGKTPQQVADDFKEFVKTVHKELPDTRVLFVSIKPSIARWKKVEDIRKANALVAEFCKAGKQLTYVDIFTPMLDKDGMPPADLFVKDGLHLSPKGYELWTSILMPHLK